MKYILAAFSLLYVSSVQAVTVTWVDKNLGWGTMMMDNERGDYNLKQYFCRENDRSDGMTVVGKAIVKSGQSLQSAICYIPWGGKEHKRTNNFDLLIIDGDVSQFPSMSSSFRDLPAAQSLFVDLQSYEQPKGLVTYGCYSQGSIGKYILDRNACYIPWNGKEYKMTNHFQVLQITNWTIGYP